MLYKLAGLRSQIKNLKDRLKALDTSKKTQKEVKEVVDALNSLEERYAKEKAKRDEKKKLKETQNEKASETPKETNETRETTPKESVEDSESAPVNKESSDVIPDIGTDWDKVLEKKPEYKPMDKAVKKEVVKNVEKKLGPAIIGFKQDDVVKPARGSESLGRVIRCDATDENPAGLIYVFWDSGLLKDRDVAGGYYAADLIKHSAEEAPKEEPKCPCYEDQSVYCPKCKALKTSDLKSNYEEMLKDLKEEREAHYNQGNHAWVARLDKKIQDLENTIKEKFGDKQADMIDHPSGTERLVVQDFTKTTDNSDIGEQDGKDSKSDYSDQWGVPGGRDLTSANTCAICKQDFNSWEEYNAHRITKHKPDLVKSETKTSSKINAFNRDWKVTPVKKDSSIGYDISDSEGKKVMHIKPANGKEWSTAELKLAIQNELTHGFKQGKLAEKVAFLEKGSKVVILATSKDKKQVKFADLHNGVRGWVPASKVNIMGLDGQTVAHEGHTDKILAIHETESLIECPTVGVHWQKKETKSPTHDAPLVTPPATPESLHDIGSAKDCPDCHGTYVGEENTKCPTCGRFAVMDAEPIKEALKTALPSTIPNQRGYLDNPPVDKQADVKCPKCGGRMSLGVSHVAGSSQWECHNCGKIITSSLNKIAIIVEENGKFCVRSPKNKKWNGGCFSTRAAAEKRLAEVEVFKHMKGGSKKPFSKKAAEVLTDPYSALQTQVQTLRDRMSLVQERLQSNPLPKEAGNGEKDNSEMDIPTLLEDLSMGIDLLETKLQGDKVEEEDVHPAIEEMENLLWSVEEKLGITPKLSEEEKAEPEHKEIVKDLDKEATITPTSPVSPSSPVSPGASTPATSTDADKPTCALCGGMQFSDFAKYQNHMEYSHASDTMPTSPSQKNLPTTVGSKKKAADVTLTDESIEDKLTNPPVTDSTNQLMPVPPVPSPQNVQPTDDDNLDIPTVMPSSPPPPNRKWVWDAANGKFVAMPISPTSGTM